MIIKIDDADACHCTKVQQDESCPAGYPSLLCGDCGGIGLRRAALTNEETSKS